MSEALKNRELPSDIPEDQLNAAFENLTALFGAKWLSSESSSNPLQLLWKRNDITATWELFWLGVAIMRLSPSSQKWITSHVNIIKTGSRSGRIGSLFEILSLALFAAPGQSIETPAKKNQPGYDGTLLFNDGSSALVSLKNYARSYRQKQFDQMAAETSDYVRAKLASRHSNWFGIIAWSEAYPERADWTELREHLGRQVDNGCCEPNSFGNWSVSHTSPPQHANTHTTNNSFVLLVVAKHHANEQKNVESSLADAFSSFDKHVPSSPKVSSNIMLVRLGEGFSIPTIAEWTKEHLTRIGSKLDEVLFYQPAIALDRKKQGISIVHHVTAVVVGPNRHLPVKIDAPVGGVNVAPTRNVLMAGDREISLSEYHMFQRGEVYTFANLDLDKKANLWTDFGPGIIAHNVLSVFGSNETIIISPRNRLSWELSLLND